MKKYSAEYINQLKKQFKKSANMYGTGIRPASAMIGGSTGNIGRSPRPAGATSTQQGPPRRQLNTPTGPTQQPITPRRPVSTPRPPTPNNPITNAVDKYRPAAPQPPLRTVYTTPQSRQAPSPPSSPAANLGSQTDVAATKPKPEVPTPVNPAPYSDEVLDQQVQNMRDGRHPEAFTDEQYAQFTQQQDAALQSKLDQLDQSHAARQQEAENRHQARLQPYQRETANIQNRSSVVDQIGRGEQIDATRLTPQQAQQVQRGGGNVNYRGFIPEEQRQRMNPANRGFTDAEVAQIRANRNPTGDVDIDTARRVVDAKLAAGMQPTSSELAAAGMGDGKTVVASIMKKYSAEYINQLKKQFKKHASGYDGYSGMSMQQYMPVSQRRELTPEEESAIEQGSRKWLRGPFASDQDSMARRLASPLKRSLIAATAPALLGAGMGGLMGSQGNLTTAGALTGAGIGGLVGIPAAIITYLNEQKKNKDIIEAMRRLPEGNTRIRDMQSDPVFQKNQDRAVQQSTNKALQQMMALQMMRQLGQNRNSFGF